MGSRAVVPLLLVLTLAEVSAPAPRGASAGTLRVVTFNVWGSKIRRQARLRVAGRRLRQLRPDIVALQEASSQIAPVLRRRARLRGPYRVSYRDDRFEVGAALLSRRGATQLEVVQLPVQPPDDEPRIALCGRVRTPIGSAEVCNVHLSHRPEDGEIRAKQLAAADAALRRRAGSRVQLLVGDFNAPPDAREVREFLAGSGAPGSPCYVDAFANARPTEPGFTWNNANPNIRFWKEPNRRIDYILVAGTRRDGRCRVPVEVSSARLVFTKPHRGIFASDHFGVLAELEPVRASPRLRSRRGSSAEKGRPVVSQGQGRSAGSPR